MRAEQNKRCKPPETSLHSTVNYSEADRPGTNTNSDRQVFEEHISSNYTLQAEQTMSEESSFDEDLNTATL